MKRNKNESYQQYRVRRKARNQEIKQKLKARLFWNNGTYVRTKLTAKTT